MPTISEIDAPIADIGVTVGEPTQRVFAGLPLTDVAVSPAADRLSVNRRSQLCFVWISPERPSDADSCVDAPVEIGQGSVAWSPVASAVAFNDDGGGSEVVLYDIDTDTSTIVTTDATDGDDAGFARDFGPAFTADGQLYFFRLHASNGLQTSLVRSSVDGEVSATGFTVDAGFADESRAVDRTIVTAFYPNNGSTNITSIDVDTGEARSVAIDLPTVRIVDAAVDRVVVRAFIPGSSESEIFVVDLANGTIAGVGASALDPSTLRVSGCGLSPDGTRLVLIVAHQDDASSHQLLTAAINEDGSLGSLATLASGADFAPNGGDITIKPAGLGSYGEVLWREDSLVYSLGPNAIVTLPLT